MYNVREISKDLFYVGVSDRRTALFENVYPVQNGMSYNSYLLVDKKTVLFDTVEKCHSAQFFSNIEHVLGDKELDYLVVNHLEPDHSALIKDVIEKYPSVKIVCNQKAKQMLGQFFDFKNDIENNFFVVKENDKISTGIHELNFLMAPMVHWPEVMVTYDSYSKVLFSADAFGAFGALNGNLFDDEVEFDEKISEYRRYYSNIVGKYGTQVNMLLNKAKNLDIELICSLHGLMLKKNINKMVDMYQTWANYTPEIDSVLIAYGSVYGGTQNVAEILANKLSTKGVKNIKIFDVSKTHPSYILSDMFKYSKIVLASITYNNGIFVNMEHLIQEMIKHNIQNRKIALIENGSWAPSALNLMKNQLENLKNITFIEDKITIKSTCKKSQEDEINLLVNSLV